jgi:hemolysin III
VIRRIKEPANALSHMIGAVLSVLGLILLVYRGATQGSTRHVVAFAIYGGSLILLYSASAIYHSLRVTGRWTRILRKIDHSMIYVLIAGSYTPLCLVALQGAWRWGLITGIWILTALGITCKILWLDAPRWLSTLLYLVMGWLAVVALVPLAGSITWAGVIWLLVGGITYSVGALIYGTKWPRLPSNILGFHEVFHMFVLGGSMIHFWVMARYVLPLV